MPLLGGSVSFMRFRVVDAAKSSRSVVAALRRDAFTELDRTSGEEPRSVGWVELDDHDETRFLPSNVVVGGEVYATWRVDEVKVPAALIRSELARWQAQHEAAKARRATRREKLEEKEVILRRLRKQAFVSTKTCDVRWREAEGEVQIWATSAKLVEEVIIALEDGMGLRLRPLGPGARWEDGERPDVRPTRALVGEEVPDGV